jgi:P27 family predicted phage terminase small subunit
MGLSPTPTKLKVLRGTGRKDRGNRNEPRPEPLPAGSPPPDWISADAAEYWPELERVFSAAGLLTTLDAPALALLCEALADYLVARDTLDEAGPYYTTETENGSVMIRAHPAVSDRSEAWRRVRLALMDFGGTPAARTRVAAVLGEEGDDLDRWQRGS